MKRVGSWPGRRGLRGKSTESHRFHPRQSGEGLAHRNCLAPIGGSFGRNGKPS